MPDQNNEYYEESCGETEIVYDNPVLPVELNFTDIKKYSGEVINCRAVPEIENGKMVLDQGCYEGCIAAKADVEIIGAGSGNTLIICKDNKKEGVVEVTEGSSVIIRDLSLNGVTRGIYADPGSRLSLKNVAIYNVVKGGINICGDKDICGSEVYISSTLITDVKTDESNVSYGISMGSGTLNIESSKLTGFNSFGISLWGLEGLSGKVKASVANSFISDVSGGTRDYEGHGIYGENLVDITISESRISNCSSTFIFISGGDETPSVKITDLVADMIKNEEKEQGGIVFDGRITASMERVFIKNSKGNGIFSKDSEIIAQDITITKVSQDGYGENGFGMMLFDKSNSVFNRLSINESEKAGILMDGDCYAEIQNFQISETDPDRNSLEYGVGVAVQDRADLKLEKGVLEKNRESGVMVISGKVELRDVAIKDTLPRKCVEAGNCVFAAGVPFGHGVSLYSGSEFIFENIYISKNNNGMNIENSKVLKKDAGGIYFLKNISAVNAWNLENYDALEKELDKAGFCGNQSVFTTDVQPVRDEF